MVENEDFLSLFKEAVENEDISLSSKLEDIEEWDSLAVLTLISEVEDNYGLILDPDMLDECLNVSDILALVNGAS